jgi:hypothetical protein
MLQRKQRLSIVMLTVVSDPDVTQRALRAGILHVLQKNDREALCNVLDRLGGRLHAV